MNRELLMRCVADEMQRFIWKLPYCLHLHVHIVGQVVGAWVGFTLAQSYEAKQQLPTQNEAASEVPNAMPTKPRPKTTCHTLHLHLDCFIDIVLFHWVDVGCPGLQYIPAIWEKHF